MCEEDFPAGLNFFNKNRQDWGGGGEGEVGKVPWPLP